MVMYIVSKLQEEIEDEHLPNPFTINGILSIVSLAIYCELALFFTPEYWCTWSAYLVTRRIRLVSYRQDARELLHWLDCNFELVDPTVQDINKQAKSIKTNFFLPILANYIVAGQRVQEKYKKGQIKPKPQDLLQALDQYIDDGIYQPKLRKLVQISQDRESAWFGWAGPITFDVRLRNPARQVSLESIHGTVPQDNMQLKEFAYKIKSIKLENEQ
jgi:hypothetical protein